MRKNRLNVEKSFVVQCAYGDNVEYPVARIEIKVRGQGVTVEAAVSDKLPHSVLLGTDVPELVSLLKREDKALMAVTRSQAKRLKRSQPEQSREKRVDTSLASAEVVEKSIGAEILDCEKVVEESATSVGEEVAVESGNRESTAVVEEGDKDVGLPLPELKEESAMPAGENMLLGEFHFDDDVFGGSERDKCPKQTRSVRREGVTSMLELREQVRVVSTLTLARRSYRGFRRKIH